MLLLTSSNGKGNPVTIPRIELTAAVTSVKIAAYLDKQLDYEELKHTFWILGYLRNESKHFHIYVADRIQAIK